MDILKNSVTKFDCLQLNDMNDHSFEENSPFDSLFRNTSISFYKELESEAVVLLEKANAPINTCMTKDKHNQILKNKKKEFYNLNNVLNHAKYVYHMKRKTYNAELCNIKEPICKNSKTKGEDLYKLEKNNYYKKKFELLKREYEELQKNIDNKIDLELIKAGVFYNKRDTKEILDFTRCLQKKLNTNKKVIDIQNNLIIDIGTNHKNISKRLRTSKKKIQSMVELCKYYYNENTNAKRTLTQIKHLFLEYRMALENVVYCCEQIGGDKIILMDGIKAARAQTDLTIATNILKMNELDDLQKNMIICEQKINNLEGIIKQRMIDLQNESFQKRQAEVETEIYKTELLKNNKLVNEAFNNFRSIIMELDVLLQSLHDQHEIKKLLLAKKKKYNELIAELTAQKKQYELSLGQMMLKQTSKHTDIIKQESYLLHQQQEMERLRKEERQKEEQQRKVDEEEEKRKREEEEKEEQKRLEEEAERKRVEEEKKEKEITEDMEHVVAKVNEAKQFMNEKQTDQFTFEQCMDILYKSNVALTKEQMNNLKEKGLMTKEQLLGFLKSLLLNEEETLANTITFFQIWDVKKTGFLHKDLFVSILKQFGDQFSEEEVTFLQKELNSTNASNINYVEILKKWIYGNNKNTL